MREAVARLSGETKVPRYARDDKREELDDK